MLARGAWVVTATDNEEDEGEQDFFSYRQRLTLDLSFAAASLSLADDGAGPGAPPAPRELLYLSAEGLGVAVEKWGERQTVDAAIRRLQVRKDR
eukprot:tig00020710_g13342.t1